jgi:hypothetical protein
LCWNLLNCLPRHQAIRSSSAVKDLIGQLLGEALPSVDFPHEDLRKIACGSQRLERRRPRRRRRGLNVGLEADAPGVCAGRVCLARAGSRSEVAGIRRSGYGATSPFLCAQGRSETLHLCRRCASHIAVVGNIAVNISRCRHEYFRKTYLGALGGPTYPLVYIVILVAPSLIVA